MKNLDKSPTVWLGDAAQGVVEQLRRTVKARQEKRYSSPATDATRRLTKRICGERDDD